MPRRPPSRIAAIRLSEFPLVDSASAMSPGRPNAASCRANTTSNPMSLDSAVTTATSVVRARAGSGRAARPADPPGTPGLRNSAATSCASVELPPFPKVNSRPPARNASAIRAAQAARSSPWSSRTVSRSRTMSFAFSAVERRTSSMTTSSPGPPADRNGYSCCMSVIS